MFVNNVMRKMYFREIYRRLTMNRRRVDEICKITVIVVCQLVRNVVVVCESSRKPRSRMRQRAGRVNSQVRWSTCLSLSRRSWFSTPIYRSNSQTYMRIDKYRQKNCHSALIRVRMVHEKVDWTQYPILRPQFRPAQNPIQFK